MADQFYDIDPKKKLYDFLSGGNQNKVKYYRKSFEDFKKDYSNPVSIDNLFSFVNEKKFYNKSKDNFYTQYFGDISKKKESGTPSNISQTTISSGTGEDGLVPLSVSDEHVKMVTEAGKRFSNQYELKPDDKDPVKSILKLHKSDVINNLQRGEMAARSESTAQKSLQPISESDRQHEITKQVGWALTSPESVRKELKKEMFPTAEAARRGIEKIVTSGEVIEGNETATLAGEKLAEHQKVVDALKGANTLDQAAVNLAILNNDQQVKYLTRMTGGRIVGFDDEHSPLPMALRGEKMLQLLTNEDFKEIADKSLELKQQYKQELFNFPNNYPEYAAKLLAEEIAKRRDEKGLNNFFSNIVGKETTDEIVKEIIADGTLPANYQFVYEKEIRPKLGTAQSIGRGIGNIIPGLNQVVNESPIPTPGLLENISQGLEHTQVGIAKSITDLPALFGMPTLRDQIQSKEQQTFGAIKKEYETPQFEPSRLRHKLTMHGGGMVGFVAMLGGGSSALTASKIISNPKLASAAMMLMSTHGDTVDKAKALFPRNDFKQLLYTDTIGIFNAALGKYLPGQQIPRLLSRGNATIADVLSKMVDDKLTTNAAKNQLLEWFGNTAKSVLHGSEFMGALSAADDALTQILQGKNLNLSQSLEAGVEGFKVGLMATPILGGAEAALKSNRGFRDQIMHVAENKDYYIALAEREAQGDPEFAKIKDDVIANINYVGNVLKDLDQYNLSQKDRQRWVLNSLTGFIKQQRIKESTDPAVKKKLQKEAKDITDIQEAALNGIPEEKIKNNQAIRDVKELYENDFLSKGAMEMLEKTEGDGGSKKFDEAKVKPFLKFLAQQANNITEDGKFNEGSDARSSVERQYPKQLIEVANEMFPEYKKIAEEYEINKILPKEPEEKPEVKTTETEGEVDAKPTPAEGSEIKQDQPQSRQEVAESVSKASDIKVNELEFISDESGVVDSIMDLAKAKGMKDGGAKLVREHERIRQRFEALKELIKCL